MGLFNFEKSPDKAEVKKAEGMMSEEQKEMSKQREEYIIDEQEDYEDDGKLEGKLTELVEKCKNLKMEGGSGSVQDGRIYGVLEVDGNEVNIELTRKHGDGPGMDGQGNTFKAYADGTPITDAEELWQKYAHVLSAGRRLKYADERIINQVTREHLSKKLLEL